LTYILYWYVENIKNGNGEKKEVSGSG